jgi:predicted enzyme related to lactoylglutathione lyase
MLERPVMNSSFPIISVEDLNASIGFYAQLGYTQTYAFPPDGPAVFVTIERNGTTIGIATRDDVDADRFSYWVYVDDVDNTFAALTAMGSPVVAEPTTEPWGERVASLRDPDGNVVHLGAPSRTGRDD